MLLLYILWDRLTIFLWFQLQMNSSKLEYTLLKAWLSQRVNFKNAIWTWGHFRRTICKRILFKHLKKMPQKRMESFTLLFDHLAWNRASIFEWHKKKLKESRKSARDDESGVGGVRKSIQQSWLAKELGFGLLCWGFKGVQEEIPSEEASTLQIGSVAFPPGQCTSPQL